MAKNMNKEMCDCQGFYDPSGACTPAYNPDGSLMGEDPCPPSAFWGTVGGWDWNQISENALNWGYAFGFFKKPDQTALSTQVYAEELSRQRQQMMYLMIGLGVLALVILVVVLNRKKK